MVHSAKVCQACGGVFTPKPGDTKQQAERRKACSKSCAGILRSRAMQGRAARFRAQNSNLSPDIDACNCAGCKAGRGHGSDPELVAKVAAEMGVPVASGPPPKKLTPAQWGAKLSEHRRKQRAEDPAVWGQWR